MHDVAVLTNNLSLSILDNFSYTEKTVLLKNLESRILADTDQKSNFVELSK